jgi:MscS family membrane protein
MPSFNTLIAHLDEIGRAALIFIGAVIAGWVLLFLIDKAIPRITQRTRSQLDDTIINTIRLPLFLAILLLALKTALTQLTFLPSAWNATLAAGFFFLFLLVVYLLAYRLIRNLMNWYASEISTRTETRLDDQILPFFRRILLILLTVIALIVLMSHFQIEVGPLITTLGIGSLAIALAAQATLADTISGFVIMMDRPFRIGDRIELLDLDTWGDVVDIGLRSTRILTRDNRMVIIPNAVIGKSLIVNHSYPDTRYRVETEIGVAYGTDIEKARQVMIEAVRAQDWVMKDERIEALFLQYGDSALIFRVRCWIKHYVETRRIIDKLNSCLYGALDQVGIEIPFPQLDLHIQGNRNSQPFVQE